MRKDLRPLALLFALLGGIGGCCGSAEAGPPLLCHPLEVEAGVELLPWTPTRGFRGEAPGLSAEEVVSRTLELLDADRPHFARMEILRRASLALEDERSLGQALLGSLVARTEARPEDALAWFDAGVLTATYEQGGWYFRKKGGRPSLRGTDPEGWLSKAWALSGGDPRVRLAQALAEAGRDGKEVRSLFADVQAAVEDGRGGETLALNVRALAGGGMREVFVDPRGAGRDM